MLLRVSYSLVFFAVLLLHFALVTEGLRCVTCSDCDRTYPRAEECKYGFLTQILEPACFKTVIKMGDKVTVSRGCFTQMGDTREGCIGDQCIYLCARDGCNSAPSSTSHQRLLSAIGAGLLVVFSCKFFA